VPPVKIATCCYCGTRASLVLDRQRHELACAACGAPLHHLKQMPRTASQSAKRTRPIGPPPGRPQDDHRPRPKRRRKGLGRKIFEEIWDIAEDIFD